MTVFHSLSPEACKLRRAAVFATGGLAALVVSAVAAAPPIAVGTVLVSGNAAGTGGGNGESSGSVMSADGRFVAFAGTAGDLVPNDGNAFYDVFVRDLKTATTTLVSVNAAGIAAGNGNSSDPAISADGRFVAFHGAASDLAANDGSANIDVFLRDMKAGTTTLVSVNAAGTASGNGTSSSPVMSANGRFVAFVSTASDLAAGDGNGAQDVFVRDMTSGTTTLVSVVAGASGNGSSYLRGISANGRFVLFESAATNLVPNDDNAAGDVFVRDVKTATTTLVSVKAHTTATATGPSSAPVMSADGRFVAFESSASDLAADDNNGVSDVFVRDLKKATTTLVSVNLTRTGAGEALSNTPGISANGRFVAFASRASDLVANDGNGVQDVFVRDLTKRATVRVSIDAPATIGGNGPSSAAGITPSGRYVVFGSGATNLVATADSNGVSDVFVRDLKKKTTTLVGVNLAGTATGNGNSGSQTITADGRLVAFTSVAGDLVAKDGNGLVDVFVRRIR